MSEHDHPLVTFLPTRLESPRHQPLTDALPLEAGKDSHRSQPNCSPVAIV